MDESRETVAPAGATRLPLASPGQRFGAWLIDVIIASLVLSPVLSLVGPSRVTTSGQLALELGTSTALAVLYLTLFDGGPRGATPGKRLLRTRVVDARTGGPIGYNRATIRRVGYFVGGLLLYVGWLWLLFDPRRQTWHDKLAGTVVVRTG